MGTRAARREVAGAMFSPDREAERLRGLMALTGITIEELARELGDMHPTTVARRLAGQTVLTEGECRRLRAAVVALIAR